MTTSANHHLTLTLRDGKTARATVVYLQPKGERWREQTATVHILCSDWLDPYAYMASRKLPLNGFYRNVRIASSAIR